MRLMSYALYVVAVPVLFALGALCVVAMVLTYPWHGRIIAAL